MIVATASHFLLDALNHEEPMDENGAFRRRLLALDASLMLVALSAVSRRYGLLSAESLGAVAACLPDAEHLLVDQSSPSASPVHHLFPHRRWPSRSLSLRRQFLIGALAWILFLNLRLKDVRLAPKGGR